MMIFFSFILLLLCKALARNLVMEIKEKLKLNQYNLINYLMDKNNIFQVLNAEVSGFL